MKKPALALPPVVLVIFTCLAAGPAAQPVPDGSQPLAKGAVLYALNCARCHEPGVEWTEGGCRPASLAGVAERYERKQVMNLLDHGVMTMPSFAAMEQADRDLLWEYLASLPAPADAAVTPGQHCPRVKAAMAGKPLSGGCGQASAGCVGPAKGPRGRGGCACCGGGAESRPLRKHRRWSFGP